MSEPVTILAADLPGRYRILRLAVDEVVITRGDVRSTSWPLPDEPKEDRSFIATAWKDGVGWLSADGHSEEQALARLNLDVGEHYL